MSVSTVVDKRPMCDICQRKGPKAQPTEAQFDGKTRMGPWAYMCLPCYRLHGIGLGTGRGQRLYLRSEVRDDDEAVDPLHAARFDDSYDPESVDYSVPTKYDIVDGEV